MCTDTCLGRCRSGTRGQRQCVQHGRGSQEVIGAQQFSRVVVPVMNIRIRMPQIALPHAGVDFSTPQCASCGITCTLQHHSMVGRTALAQHAVERFMCCTPGLAQVSCSIGG